MVAATLPRSALAQAAAVERTAAAELDVLIGELAAWVGHDSASGDVAAVDAFAAVLAAALERDGLAIELVPDAAGLHLHASLEGDGRAQIALLGHHDTVFPAGTARVRPLVRDGGRLLGPGVADMKGGLAVAAHVARAFAAGPRPFRRLEIVSVPDEELRSAPFATLDRLRGFDAALCLECGRPGGGVVTARKGGRWPVVRAVGRPAHAGAEPEHGRNAIVALCAEAVRIAALDGAVEGLTVQVTTFAGGEAVNSVPAVAALGVDVRAWHARDLDWAMAEIERFGGHDGVDIELGSTEATPPLERTPAVARLAGAAAGIAAELGVVAGEVATGGASDGCWTAGLGIPTLDGLGPVGALDHTPAEYVEIASFAPRCGIVAGLVAAVDGGLLAGAR
jgi:glutamate carboxypeptidase